MNADTHTLCLGDLLKRADAAHADLRVSGIAYDSRRVQPGDLFFALTGVKADGAQFAAQAIRNGAVAVVAERDLNLSVPVVVVENARQAMADAARRFWGNPDRMVNMVGITGTNGKSTVAAGLRHVWQTAGVEAGLIGTLRYEWRNESIVAQRTTPESPDLIAMLARMRDDHVRQVAIEVSSHAIALDRVWGLHFQGGVYTNLTRDHLDYHGTLEEYRRVKSLFFSRLSGERSFAAINLDDPSADFFLRAAGDVRTIGYSIQDQGADISLVIESHTLTGSRGQIRIGGETYAFASPLWGRFNHANLAAIAAAAFGSGLSGEAIVAGLGDFHGIPGRMEPVATSAPFSVFVDYAHTPDALDAVLSAARPLVSGRLLVVFGCGGDRDRGKRPQMAQAVERWADLIYLTSDNPRSEDPLRIIDDAKKGFSAGTQFFSEPDRVCAIERSIADAQPGDAVILCGKGHEETQDIAGVLHQLSDRDTAARILAARGHAPQTSNGGGSFPG